MNKTLDLSIIIVGYNSENTILGCLKSILETVKKNTFEIIISDNSPNDLTELVIEKEFKKDSRIFYIRNQENLGFSKGNNVGIKSSTGEYILFLNPDTKVYEGTIDGMMDFMRKTPTCGASTCFMELSDGTLDDSSHRGFPTPWRSFSHFSGLAKLFPQTAIFGGYNLGYLDLSKTHEIESLAGSFMLVPRSVGEKVGWWDEEYFFYGEDLDFCYKIKKEGYKIYFVPDFRALHMKGISSGIKDVSKNVTKASIETKRFATHHRFAAMEIFYNKHYRNKYPQIVTAMVMAGINLKRKLAMRKLG